MGPLSKRLIVGAGEKFILNTLTAPKAYPESPNWIRPVASANSDRGIPIRDAVVDSPPLTVYDIPETKFIAWETTYSIKEPDLGV